MGRSAERTRQVILEAAYKLFYRHGFARVALDMVAEEAGVTKRTLYYHFRSKDDLLAAALEFDSDFAAHRVTRWGIDSSLDLDGAIDALFDSLRNWGADAGFRGGGYTRIAMELADLPGHPARLIARRQKALVEGWLAKELERRGAGDPEECARQIQLLIEGAMAMMLIHGDPTYARIAAEAAKTLVREKSGGKALPDRPPKSVA
jgi:AcrR family transcriptional regulator